jgi:hypothetical protein
MDLLSLWIYEIKPAADSQVGQPADLPFLAFPYFQPPLEESAVGPIRLSEKNIRTWKALTDNPLTA